MKYTIWKEFRFEAAHRLPNLPSAHKCSKMHGHSYVFRLYVEGKRLNPTLGWVTDFGGLVKAAGDLLVAQLDHAVLNEIAGLENPTIEVLATWIGERVRITQLGELDEFSPCLVAVEAQETPTSGVRVEWS